MTYHVQAYYLARHRDEPDVLSSPDDIDALVDRLLALPIENSVAALYLAERPTTPAGFPDHEFCIAVDRELRVGALKFMDETGNWASLEPEKGGSEVRRYYLTGNETEFPPRSGIPLGQARQAGKDFLIGGGRRPTCVSWQEDTCV